MDIPYPDGKGGWTRVGPTRAPPLNVPTAVPVGTVVAPVTTSGGSSAGLGGFVLIALAAVGIFAATLSIKPGAVAARQANPIDKELLKLSKDTIRRAHGKLPKLPKTQASLLAKLTQYGYTNVQIGHGQGPEGGTLRAWGNREFDAAKALEQQGLVKITGSDRATHTRRGWSATTVDFRVIATEQGLALGQEFVAAGWNDTTGKGPR